MKIQPKPGQEYFKIGTRMAQNNYITHANGDAYSDYASCLRAIANLKQPLGYLAPVKMTEPRTIIPTQEEIDHAFDAEFLAHDALLEAKLFVSETPEILAGLRARTETQP